MTDKIVFTSTEVREVIRQALEGKTYAEVARRLALNDETLRTAVTGDKELAETVLSAFGFERIVLYRRKRV